MTTHRKLAAILAADVAGYSRLMADDERATVDTLNTYRHLIRERVTRHEGRVVDAPGDALLAEFPSAVEAVDCATEIQHELAKRNSQLAEHRRMVFRIGINLGDVIEQEDGTIYGDGVNVAARLQQLGELSWTAPVPLRGFTTCTWVSGTWTRPWSTWEKPTASGRPMWCGSGVRPSTTSCGLILDLIPCFPKCAFVNRVYGFSATTLPSFQV